MEYGWPWWQVGGLDNLRNGLVGDGLGLGSWVGTRNPGRLVILDVFQ